MDNKVSGRACSYDALRSCHLNDRRVEFIVQRLKSYQLPEHGKILEIGSGTGWLLLRLAHIFPQYEFIGIELDQEYVAYAQGQSLPGNLSFLKGSAEDIDQKISCEVALVLSNDVLHHMQPIMEQVIRSIAGRVDRRGCRWLSIEPNCLNLYVSWTHWRWRKQGERIFLFWEFLRLCKKFAWRLVGFRYLFLVPARYKSVPKWVAFLERIFEWVPVLAGGIVLELSFSDKGRVRGDGLSVIKNPRNA